LYLCPIDDQSIVLHPGLTLEDINKHMYSSKTSSPIASPSHPRGKVNQNVAEVDSEILATEPSDVVEGAQGVDTVEGTDMVEGADTV
jgi:hypothetical protein